MRNLVVAVAVIVVGGIAAMSVGTLEIPCTLRVPGGIVPIREWVITCAEGRLATVWSNNVGGAVQEYSILQAENGDLVDYRLHPSVVPGGTVAAGDTIALATSIRLDRQLAQLRGELRCPDPEVGASAQRRFCRFRSDANPGGPAQI